MVCFLLVENESLSLVTRRFLTHTERVREREIEIEIEIERLSAQGGAAGKRRGRFPTEQRA